VEVAGVEGVDGGLVHRKGAKGAKKRRKEGLTTKEHEGTRKRRRNLSTNPAQRDE
jgi:hypothetical protein